MQLDELQQWHKTAPGNWLLQFEQEQVKKWLPLVRGATVVQFGGMPDTFNIAKHHNGHYYFMSPYTAGAGQPGVDLLAQYEELPFAPNSVNLVLLVHVLEYVDHPTVVLKEIFDMLAPNGKLLLFCFNPWSLWGAKKWLSKGDVLPWKGKFISPARMQGWLASLGYSNLKDKTLCFRSANNKRRLTRWDFFLEALGQITVPMMGAVNVFLVEKRVYAGIAERRYQWNRARVGNNIIVEPTARTKSG